MQTPTEQKLANLLDAISFSELPSLLDNEIRAIWEYDTPDRTKNSLIRIAIALRGTNILADRKLRAVVLANQVGFMGKDRFYQSFSDFKGKEIEDAITDLAVEPWRSGPRVKSILGFLGIESVQEESQSRFEPAPDLESLSPQERFYGLLDYQYDIMQSVNRFITTGLAPRCIVHMPTGTGKTKTAMHIIEQYWQLFQGTEGIVLWVANSEELLEQAIRTFKSVWRVHGRKAVSIARYWGAQPEPPLDGSMLIFGGVQKLQGLLRKKPAYLEALRKNLRLIVFDEAHRAPAAVTRELLGELLRQFPGETKRPLVGLTATPGRKNGFEIEDERLKNMFQSRIFGIDLDLLGKYHEIEPDDDPISHLQIRRILSKIERKVIEVEQSMLNLSPEEIVNIERTLQRSEDSEINKAVLEKIAASKERNRLIVEALTDLYNKSYKTIVFACSVEHAKLLATLLEMRGIAAIAITGDMDRQSRHSGIRSFLEGHRRIIINYNVLSVGFDDPEINCVFIARPVGSLILYSQMLGRGIRGPLMGGAETCLLVDVVDNLQFKSERWAFDYFHNYWKRR